MSPSPNAPAELETVPRDSPPVNQQEPAVAAAAATADLENLDFNQVLRDLQRSDLLRELADTRSVALAFIDRHQEVHFFAAGGAALSSTRPSAPLPETIAGPTVNAISPREIDQVCAVYEPPLAYAAAQCILRDEGLLILYGKPGTGKRATAIHLLAGLDFGQEARPAIYELDPNLALLDLHLDAVPPNTALLLETANHGLFQGVDSFRLTALRATLAKKGRNIALVVVVNDLPPAFPGNQRGVTCAWTPGWTQDLRTIQRTILARHLRYRLGVTGNAVEASEPLLARLVESPELDAMLGEPHTMGDLAELAIQFAPVLRGAAHPQHALAGLDARATQDVRAWFESPTHSQEHKTLLVAAAAFNGALVQEVEQAALRFQTLIGLSQPSEETQPIAVPPVDPFAAGNSRSRRLQEINAEIVEISVDGGHYGTTIGHALQLRNGAWQKAVLYYVWDDLPGLQQPLVEWLRQYGAGGNRCMRVRAAAALGALARRNFPLIEREVLRSWAMSHQRQERENAGQVLGITMWDEKQRGASARLLATWAGQRTDPRLQWTAAAACGGLAGLRYPQQTFAALRAVAENTLTQPGLLEPLFLGMRTAYLGYSAPECRLAVLQTLVQWSDPTGAGGEERARRKAAERAALAAFWMILWPTPGALGWRQVLADAGAPGTPQALTITLLRRSLNFRIQKGLLRAGDDLHPRDIARAGLAALVVESRHSEDEQLIRDLEKLVHALTAACHAHDAETGSQEMERLRYYAQDAADWNGARKVAPELVAQFL